MFFVPDVFLSWHSSNLRGYFLHPSQPVLLKHLIQNTNPGCVELTCIACRSLRKGVAVAVSSQFREIVLFK